MSALTCQFLRSEDSTSVFPLVQALSIRCQNSLQHPRHVLCLQNPNDNINNISIKVGTNCIDFQN